MEVKINREIRNYTEAVFFGLSLRQIIFSVCALAVSVGVFFLLKPTLGTETTSWICIIAAAPFAALGFVKYNGMTAEKFIVAWVKSEFLFPNVRKKSVSDPRIPIDCSLSATDGVHLPSNK